MKLHDLVLRLILFERFADAELGYALLARRVIIALEYHHVAAVAAAASEIAAARGSILYRRHHFDELIGYREDSVLQTKDLDRRIAKSHLKTEHVADILHDRRKIACNQFQLFKTKPHGKLPRLPPFEAGFAFFNFGSERLARISSLEHPKVPLGFKRDIRREV